MTGASNKSLVIAAVMFAMVGSGRAWSQHAGMPGMAMARAPSPGGSMMEGMEKMSRDMAAVPMTGDADRDFASMMIPHHRGALDMARYELAHGKDPAMLKLAREIVAAQEREIAAMNAWLAKHSKREP